MFLLRLFSQILFCILLQPYLWYLFGNFRRRRVVFETIRNLDNLQTSLKQSFNTKSSSLSSIILNWSIWIYGSVAEASVILNGNGQRSVTDLSHTQK